jgi:hypothetical protein
MAMTCDSCGASSAGTAPNTAVVQCQVTVTGTAWPVAHSDPQLCWDCYVKLANNINRLLVGAKLPPMENLPAPAAPAAAAST